MLQQGYTPALFDWVDFTQLGGSHMIWNFQPTGGGLIEGRVMRGGGGYTRRGLPAHWPLHPCFHPHHPRPIATYLLILVVRGYIMKDRPNPLIMPNTEPLFWLPGAVLFVGTDMCTLGVSIVSVRACTAHGEGRAPPPPRACKASPNPH